MRPIAIKTETGWGSATQISDWGGGGAQWYLKLSGKDTVVLDDPSAIGAYTQLEYLQALSADKYILEVADKDWKHLANADEVLYLILDHVCFSEEDAGKYSDAIRSLKTLMDNTIDGVGDVTGNLIENFGLSAKPVSEELSRKGKVFVSEVMDIRQSYERILNAYSTIRRGEILGLEWSNEHFLREFKGTREANLIEEHLRSKRAS